MKDCIAALLFMGLLFNLFSCKKGDDDSRYYYDEDIQEGFCNFKIDGDSIAYSWMNSQQDFRGDIIYLDSISFPRFVADIYFPNYPLRSNTTTISLNFQDSVEVTEEYYSTPQ